MTRASLASQSDTCDCDGATRVARPPPAASNVANREGNDRTSLWTERTVRWRWCPLAKGQLHVWRLPAIARDTGRLLCEVTQSRVYQIFTHGVVLRQLERRGTDAVEELVVDVQPPCDAAVVARRSITFTRVNSADDSPESRGTAHKHCHNNNNAE